LVGTDCERVTGAPGEEVKLGGAGKVTVKSGCAKFGG